MQQTYQKFPNKLLKIYRWKSQIEWKTLRFLHQRIFLIEMTLWIDRMQFIQPRREIFNIRSKKIAQCKKKSKTIFFSEKNTWSVFMGTSKAVFTNLSKNFRRGAKKLSPTFPKGKIKQYFFLKISFWKNVRMGTKKAVLTTSPTVFWQNAKLFNSKNEKNIISSVFRKKCHS